MTTIVLTEHFKILICEFREHVMDFKVGSSCQTVEGEWEAFNPQDIELDGTLKWDGCINWQTNPECMMHGCGPHHAHAIAAIFQAIYHVGGRQFDFLGDDAPEPPDGFLEL